MEGSKTIWNISKKDSASLNIKFETDCAAENGEASAQYVSGRRSSILTTLSDRRAPAQNLLDNNVIFNQTKENYTGDTETSNSFSETLFNDGLGDKTNKIKQIIESAISPESKQTVSKILDQVNQLSIAEKLLLYLKLPTGRSQSTDPLRQPLNPLGSRFEIHQTITWIKTHLEEDQDISLPKQDVYDEYIAYCDSIEMKPLSTADFGKVMKQVFPRVRPRRLGTRGNSRYCYAGMRKRVTLEAPLLPDLGEPGEDRRIANNECLSAASCLIREWAEKLLSVKFDSLQDLACHLVGNLCVDSRSVAAFTLMSALEPRRFFSEKDVTPLLLPCSGQANKHRETQLQLQRKLQEREVIREQKRKLQDQYQSSAHRTPTSDKPRVKRSKLSHQAEESTVKTLPIQSADTSTQISDKACRSNGRNEISACKVKVSETSQTVGFGQVLPIPTNSRNSGDASKPAIRAQCRNVPSLHDMPNVKSRHLSLDLEPNLTRAKTSGRNSATVLCETESKSSLRFYLESLPAKKPRKLPPVQNLSKELAPNVLKTPQSPDAFPGLSTTSPPPAKLPIPRLVNPNKKMPTNLIILPPIPTVQKSPRNKYKPIQPKVESPTDEQRNKGSAFLASKTANRSPRKPRPSLTVAMTTESLGNLASIACDEAKPPVRRRNEVSVGCLEKDALDDYLHGGGNSQEQEEELMRYFQQDTSPPPPPENNPSVKLSQLRLLLERNLSVTPTFKTNHSASLSLSAMSHRSQLQTRLNRSSLVLPSLPQTYPNSRRRVSFETSVPPSPNTRRRTFNFTPIGVGQRSPLRLPSSTEASPFVSPGNTPVPRSKQNPNQLPSFIAAGPNNIVPNLGNISQNIPGQKTSTQPNVQVQTSSNNGIQGSNPIRGGFGDGSRLQRSQSVNGNAAALQYLLQTSEGGGFGSRMFAVPGGSTNSSNTPFHSFPRAAAMSVSAPQSPIVNQRTGASLFDLKGESNSLLEGMLSKRGLPDDQCLTANDGNILGLRSIDTPLVNAASLDKEQTVDECSLGSNPAMLRTDALSQEVSRFFPDNAMFRREVPDFAQLRFRSQSVPLRSSVGALVSNFCLDLDFAEGGSMDDGSMAPTPVPTEFRDFGPDIGPTEGLNSENLSRIFNLLDAGRLDLDGGGEQPPNTVSMARDILMMGGGIIPPTADKLEILPPEYRTSEPLVNYNTSENDLDVKGGLQGYEDYRDPLPYTGYVIPLELRARLGDNAFNELLTLPLTGVDDGVSQLEQEVDKL